MILGNVYTSRRSKVILWPIGNQSRKILPAIHTQEKGIYLFKSYTIPSDNVIYITSRIEASSQLSLSIYNFRIPMKKNHVTCNYLHVMTQRNLGAFRQQLLDAYIFKNKKIIRKSRKTALINSLNITLPLGMVMGGLLTSPVVCI